MPYVSQVLDVLAAAGVDGDDETYEWLANAAVRSVEFVTVRLPTLGCCCCCGCCAVVRTNSELEYATSSDFSAAVYDGERCRVFFSRAAGLLLSSSGAR